MQKLNIFIRRAYKNALGLPERTATERLVKLGVHNSTEELHEAELISQLRRLEGTANGSWLLDKLELAVPGGPQEGEETGGAMDYEVRQRIVFSRISRNMHPDRDVEWRQARSAVLSRSWDSREGTLYVDGASPVSGVVTIAIANGHGSVVRIVSIRTHSTEQAEEATIALAIVCNSRATIIFDSQKACRN
ncbi:hypothetical protein HPB47_003505 [Ixodes persulcatus]|uniref:Uncharacterized protein n=1 Tax=Ixodes persulcatus TaxID=34615 RepID=A0AC60PJC2_IXOPE|nr:hypothetical protein HPB47_003505 [Ixodes persulcatus]